VEYFEREADLINYDNLDSRNFQLERRRTEILMDLLKLASAKSLLDVGCGDGLQLEYIEQKYPCLVLTGIDISKTRIYRAERRVFAIFKAIPAEEINLEFKKEIFDRALCSEVLEHVQNPRVILENIYDVLTDGGIFVVSVPYNEKILEIQCAKCGQMTTTGHINSFDELKLKSVLEYHNFEVLSVRGYSMATVPFMDALLPYPIWMIAQRVLTRCFKRVKPYYLIAVARK
jgi:ubiquinone/menaquinone biosynthesis C-methylase UbiE